jgi:hypothetical protein
MHQLHPIAPRCGARIQSGSLRDFSLIARTGAPSGAKALRCVVFPLLSYSGSVPARGIRDNKLFFKDYLNYIQ